MSHLSLDTLPPEIIGLIGTHTRPADYLMLKSTCKTVSACMPKHLITLIIEQCLAEKNLSRHRVRETYIESQKAYEAVRNWKSCTTLLCTDCGHVRPRGGFADAQRRSFRPKFADRRCLDCNMRDSPNSHSYLTKDSVLVDKKQLFPCSVCCTMKPLSDRQDRGRLYASGTPVWATVPDATDYGSRLQSRCKTCADALDTRQLSYQEATTHLRPFKKAYEWTPYFAWMRRGRYLLHDLYRCWNCMHWTFDPYSAQDDRKIINCSGPRCPGPRKICNPGAQLALVPSDQGIDDEPFNLYHGLWPASFSASGDFDGVRHVPP